MGSEQWQSGRWCLHMLCRSNEQRLVLGQSVGRCVPVTLVHTTPCPASPAELKSEGSPSQRTRGGSVGLGPKPLWSPMI
ncbi:hypothetical protein PAHAL_5G016300 [Panicum hallii]|uniref:Uncharacterized protein n=1 Tax=Panicum hallii TaxID=206008 RepID=A0A2T8III1_9POAL|nr:hypothetical protein PAHAL_5G016300 [Panicum hallii]